MLGYRMKQPDGNEPYVWYTYAEVVNKAETIGRGFRVLGYPSGQETRIGLFSENRPEWLMIEHALYTYSNVLVPFPSYETVGSEARHFINICALQLVVVDSIPRAKALIYEKTNWPSLKNIVVIQPILPKDLYALAQKSNITLHTLFEIEDMGRQSRVPHVPPQPNDLAVICFTSGTTGIPKGVPLTHDNIIACSTAALTLKNTRINKNDVHMSYLPLAHMFDRTVMSVMFAEGGRVGFYRGDALKLLEDLQELRPTILPVVPHILYKIHDRVMNEVNKSLVKKVLFKISLAYKRRLLNSWIIRNDTFVDKRFFAKIRESLGGRVKLMMTGSAPLSPDVLEFIRCVMGCVVVEGYGQTECICALR